MKPKLWRQKNKLTLDALSKIIGFSKGYLSEVENGKKVGSFRLANAYREISGGKVRLEDFGYS